MDEYIELPNGELIRRSDIIAVTDNFIIYRDAMGRIKKLELETDSSEWKNETNIYHSSYI